METIGWLLLVLVPIGVGILLYLRKIANAQGQGGSSAQSVGTRSGVPPGNRSPSVAFTPPRTGEDEVESGEDPFLNINGEMVEVRGRGRFLELRAFGPDKKIKVHKSPETGRDLNKYKVLSLGDRRLLVEQPTMEQGGLAYFLYSDRSRDMTPTILGNFETQAKAFALSDQKGEIDVSAFGKTWRLHDIMWFDIEATQGDVLKSRPGRLLRCQALLGKCGDEWMFFIREVDTKSATCWIGREFDPKVEICV